MTTKDTIEWINRFEMLLDNARACGITYADVARIMDQRGVTDGLVNISVLLSVQLTAIIYLYGIPKGLVAAIEQEKDGITDQLIAIHRGLA